MYSTWYSIYSQLGKNSNEYYELEEGSGYNYYVNVSVMDYIDNNGSKRQKEILKN